MLRGNIMVWIEKRKITQTKKGAVISLNSEYLDEIGLSVGKRYTVIYDDNTKTVSVSDNEIESVIIKSNKGVNNETRRS